MCATDTEIESSGSAYGSNESRLLSGDANATYHDAFPPADQNSVGYRTRKCGEYPGRERRSVLFYVQGMHFEGCIFQRCMTSQACSRGPDGRAVAESEQRKLRLNSSSDAASRLHCAFTFMHTSYPKALNLAPSRARACRKSWYH